MRRRSKFALGAAGLAGAAALAFAFTSVDSGAAAALADLPVGTAAPDFAAKDANGRAVRLSDFSGRTVVLEWNNPKCPTVKEHYDGGVMQKAQAAATADGTVWLTINSSGPWRQGNMNGAQAKAYVASQKARPTAYLLDPEGAVGRAYGAKTTPHMYVISKAGTLVYRGAMRGGMEGPAAGGSEAERNHVLAALSELKAGKPVSVPTTRPYGCAVKYKW